MISDFEQVLNHLKHLQLNNHGFVYAIENDDYGHGHGNNVFWADETCRLNYTNFGDTVVFDTSYRTRSYLVPFVAFTGLNNHNQPVLFGSALMLNDSESSFVWLLQAWIQSMSCPHPGSITVEPDRLIQVAVSRVLSRSRVRFSQDLIFRETQKKLGHDVYSSSPGFESEFVRCVIETESVDEFEECWSLFVRRYYLESNDWLCSVYNARMLWVPVYIKDSFYGDLYPNHGGFNSFFKGFVDETTTMQTVLKQCEKAVEFWREKELKADYEETNSTPVLKTPSPMEKQAASLYTREAFVRFQDEFVETLANPANRISGNTYRVAKFGEPAHKGHTVIFDSLEARANCSCRMFEYSGIVCRHVLAVFRAENVLVLPSWCILRRWTKEAKISNVDEEQQQQQQEFSNSCQESLGVCYDNLRQEATKYVEEGAKSIQIYKVAMDALDIASKKVSAASNKLRTGTSTHPNGDSYASEEGVDTVNHQGGEKERTILELTDELERTGQRCEVYRANLQSILRDMEEQKYQLSLKVQNARLSLKE